VFSFPPRAPFEGVIFESRPSRSKHPRKRVFSFPPRAPMKGMQRLTPYRSGPPGAGGEAYAEGLAKY